MKTALVLIAGIVLGVLATVLGAWLYMGHVMETIAESPLAIPLDAKGRVEKSLLAYRDAKDEYGRWLALTDGVLWSVDVEPAAKTREDANTVLSASERYRSDWNYGNAVHKANLALGRLALRDGNIEQAKHFLIEAGKTPGSPQLDSFGPNMLLAKELLEKGEAATVLEYLDLCNKFWRIDHGSISTWKKLIAEGKQPNFFANLVY
jgi:hypothetical protein